MSCGAWEFGGSDSSAPNGTWRTNKDDYPDFYGSDSEDPCVYVTGGEARKMVDTLSGLDHLEGETIKVQVDGILPTGDNAFVVSSGQITLPAKAAVIHAGLGYEGKIQLLKTSDGSAIGTGQFKMRRVYLAAIRFIKSLGLKVGYDEDNLDPIFPDTPALPLYTGDKEKLPKTTWKQDSELIFKQEDPLPCHILAILLRSEVEEK